MRFRNRFKCDSARAVLCEDCGLRIAVTIGDGRETRIHEFPLCEPFKAWVAFVKALPTGKAHDLAAVMTDDVEKLTNIEVHEFDAEPQ
jgi:hypothetical protein